ncbi:MAG: tail fiber domain-containing protein, partial [Flavobacteriaceae bacterium]
EDANSTGWRINTAGSFNTFSDRRLKTNIRDANIPIDYTKLSQLKLQAFSFIDYVEALKKDDGKNKKKTARLKEKTQSIGYIAQDLKAVFPNAVMEDTLGGDGYLLLDHNQLLYSMLEVIANQEKRMQEMAVEIDLLQDQIERLK